MRDGKDKDPADLVMGPWVYQWQNSLPRSQNKGSGPLDSVAGPQDTAHSYRCHNFKRDGASGIGVREGVTYGVYLGKIRIMG